jgi:Protein of unknown function (DUF2844)
MMRMTPFVVAVAVLSAVPARLSASLGGTVSSVETDRVQMKAAQLRIIQTANYRFHELQSATGVTIREYYGAAGTVFGVAWEGPWPPDMRQLLGPYFEQFQRASQAGRATRRTRGVHGVNDGGLVVQISGHARAFSGYAYAPGLLPPGVQPGVIR